MAKISDLVGKNLVRVERIEGYLQFEDTNGERWRMGHVSDCCEDVYLEDVVGDLEDLVGTPILKAEESMNRKEPPPEGYSTGDSYTWTFYHIRTVKGSVTLRWFGESNGYYSETAEFYHQSDWGYKHECLGGSTRS